MKCNSRKSMREKYWQIAFKFAQDNLKAAVLALHRYLGFGARRIERFLDGLAAMAAESDEATRDDVIEELDAKWDEEIRSIGLGDTYIEQLFRSDIQSNAEYNREHRERKNISFREATEAAKKLQAMKEYLNTEGNHNESEHTY